METTPRHSVSVAAVILDDDEDHVLLIRRRDNDRWEPPGGILELGETLDEGVRREVREETGLDVRVERLSGVYKNMRRGIVALVFRCTAGGRPSAESAEASVVAWVPLHQVADLMTPAYAVRVLDAVSNAAITPRAHDGTQLVPSDG